MPRTWIRCPILLAWLLALGVSASVEGAVPAEGDDGPELPLSNRVVLAVISDIEPGGGYQWKDTGVPFDLVHDGRTVLARSKQGTYCCGVTFAAGMRTATELGLLADKSYAQVKTLQQNWYGTDDDSAERQCVYGMERLGIGHAVEHDEALPGDFAQFWRGRSGHSVVFLAWVHDEHDNRIGLRYWSSQRATDGIGEHTEYFAGVEGHDGSVDPQRLYLGRLLSPEEESRDEPDQKPKRVPR